MLSTAQNGWPRATPTLFEPDVPELCRAERIDLETGDALAQWLVDGRMRNRRKRHLLLKDFLRLHIVFRALGRIGRLAAFLDQVVERLVAPFREVAAVDRRAAEQHAEPVVRIAVGAGPADHQP